MFGSNTQNPEERHREETQKQTQKMSVNSSSSSNDSLLHPDLSSNTFIKCYVTRPGSFIYVAYRATNILLLLPLSIFIIYLGLQQWRLKRSTSSAATMSHSDSFTYNMVTMELIGVFGSVLVICGICSYHVKVFLVGYFVLSFSFYGEVFFHVLTCVERYLAVVHPITYLSLRKERGIRIRNISIGCVWLLCFAETMSMMMNDDSIVVDFCILISSVTVISFCSLSVLRVLIRPGPGEQGAGRERVDQSKQRAFYTIMVILGVLVLKFTWSLVWAVLFSLGISVCEIMMCSMCFLLPSSLVLPLLFLHRAGKLVCWKKNIQ